MFLCCVLFYKRTINIRHKEELRELSGESILANMIAESIRPFKPNGRKFAVKYEITSLALVRSGYIGVLLEEHIKQSADSQIYANNRKYRQYRQNNRLLAFLSGFHRKQPLHKFLVCAENSQADKKCVSRSGPESRGVVEIKIKLKNAKPSCLTGCLPHGG